MTYIHFTFFRSVAIEVEGPKPNEAEGPWYVLHHPDCIQLLVSLQSTVRPVRLPNNCTVALIGQSLIQLKHGLNMTFLDFLISILAIFDVFDRGF